MFQSREELDASPEGRSPTYVVARSQEEAYSKARAEHGEHVVLNREPDVLDTWFSSGLWPFSSLGRMVAATAGRCSSGWTKAQPREHSLGASLAWRYRLQVKQESSLLHKPSGTLCCRALECVGGT